MAALIVHISNSWKLRAKFQLVMELIDILTLSCIMSQNGQIHKILKVCLTILGHYALKGINPFFSNIPFWSLWKYQKIKSFFWN